MVGMVRKSLTNKEALHNCKLDKQLFAYAESLGYEPKTMTECFDILNKCNVNFDQFSKPAGYEDWEEYIAFCRYAEQNLEFHSKYVDPELLIEHGIMYTTLE